MRKLTSLLTLLLLTIVGGTGAWAQLPAVSDESNEYLYYIYNSREAAYYATTTSNDDKNVGTATADGTDDQSVTRTRLIVRVEASGTDGQYYIISKTTDFDGLYVGFSAASSNQANTVRLYDTTDNKNWIFNVTVSDGKPGVTISPAGQTGASWNMHGGVGKNIGFYSATDGGATWVFVPANEAAFTKMAEDATTQLGYGSTTEIGKVSTTSAEYVALNSAEKSTYNEENAKALAFALKQSPVIKGKLYLPSGVYKMKSMNTVDTKPDYVYNDYLLEGNDKGASFMSDAASATNNYYWKVTNNGANITILNGQGTPVCKGAQGNGWSGTFNTYSTLNFGAYDEAYFTEGGGGIWFTEGLNAPDADDYKYNGTFFLTTWLTNWGITPGKADVRWTFEAVEGDVYTVNITGTESYISEVPYATLTATSEIALNGGFFVCSSAPSAGDFTAYSSDNYTGTYSVDTENKTITLALTITPAVALQNALEKAEAVVAASQAHKIGYPKETNTTELNALQSAIATAKALSDVTESDVTTLTNAMTAFMALTDVYLPESGKAYTFTFRRTDVNATPKYIYRESLTSANLRTADVTGSALPNTAVFVCKINEDETYSFIPAYGTGYMAYNRVVVDSYNADYNSATIKPLVDATLSRTYITDQSVTNLCGYVCITFKKRGASTSPDANGCMIIKESTGAFDNSSAPYLNSNFTSAISIEEVEYPTSVTMNTATGIDDAKNIATFSAPFATVVPADVEAYIVSATTEDNNATTTLLAEAGTAIPAATGVLLYGTAASAVMVPATTEIVAAIPDGVKNLLGHSAGAAKDMSSATNAYVLGLVDGKVAFYSCTSGTLAMNKSYLQLSGSDGAAGFELNFGGQTTGIASVAAPAGADAPVFDLSGRRVARLQKGSLYIQNGQKFIAQ